MSNLQLKQNKAPVLSLAYIAGLWLTCLGLAWLTAAFAPPWYAWLAISAVVIYLCHVGLDGLAIANVGLILLMSMATLRKSWPTSLEIVLPDHDVRQWATLLIVVWIGAMLWLGGLSYGRSHVQQLLRGLGLPVRYAPSGLTLLMLLAGLIGWLIHDYWF
ncbi:MAG: hypothetical protein WBA10_19865 [Elainellaceae cyanobacterium]